MNKTEVINRLKPTLYNLRRKHDWLTGKLSLSMAQIIIESNWLKSAPKNNCLGIKWTSKYPESRKQMLWTKEWVNGKYVSVLAPFLTFKSIEECIEEGYIRILKLDRYKETRDCIDWWDATQNIRIDGYCTSPTYTDTLRNLILKEKIYEIDWLRPYDWQLDINFLWGETFSPVRFKGITYTRIIEAPKDKWGNVVDLAIQLQIGRDFVGQPFIITPRGAWGRITEYNYQAGGAKESQHLFWNGADIYNPKKLITYEFYKIMNEKTDCSGYGLGSNFLHIDRRKDKEGKLVSPKKVWHY
ncbi:MAG: hypothetical protein A2163_04015 [Actinobacteria bacterium RBG_13_35_12]|nr:MAG: hypothetical protein A2163_04015 [Actinobacteria bacterium RBG_13_35_12]